MKRISKRLDGDGVVRASKIGRDEKKEKAAGSELLKHWAKK